MYSILQTEQECFITGNTTNIAYHHIYFGSGLRSVSDQNGFTCFLSVNLHTETNEAVHQGNRVLDLHLKKMCQAKFEETHTRDEFMALIGRNYLD